jgi:hypothetical protein
MAQLRCQLAKNELKSVWYPQKNYTIAIFLFIRILNPILMKKYLFFR